MSAAGRAKDAVEGLREHGVNQGFGDGYAYALGVIQGILADHPDVVAAEAVIRAGAK